MLQLFRRPTRSLIHVAGSARIRDFVQFGLCGRDEAERVAAHHHLPESLLDLGHVARHAFIAGASGLVMGVLFDASGTGPVRRIRSVAL